MSLLYKKTLFISIIAINCVKLISDIYMLFTARKLKNQTLNSTENDQYYMKISSLKEKEV